MLWSLLFGGSGLVGKRVTIVLKTPLHVGEDAQTVSVHGEVLSVSRRGIRTHRYFIPTHQIGMVDVHGDWK